METSSDSKNCRNQRKCDRDRDRYAHRARNAQGLKKGQPSKRQTETGPGNSQTGGQDNLGDPVVSRVVRRLPTVAGLTCLLVPPDKKYPVVGSSRQAHRYQQINCEGGESNNVVIAKKCDQPLGYLQFYPDYQQ